ncbi:hypothetical protein N303_03710, partial [Cuculus canorus]
KNHRKYCFHKDLIALAQTQWAESNASLPNPITEQKEDFDTLVECIYSSSDTKDVLPQLAPLAWVPVHCSSVALLFHQQLTLTSLVLVSEFLPGSLFSLSLLLFLPSYWQRPEYLFHPSPPCCSPSLLWSLWFAGHPQPLLESPLLQLLLLQPSCLCL